jgi:hypothetical protein
MIERQSAPSNLMNSAAEATKYANEDYSSDIMSVINATGVNRIHTGAVCAGLDSHLQCSLSSIHSFHIEKGEKESVNFWDFRWYHRLSTNFKSITDLSVLI